MRKILFTDGKHPLVGELSKLLEAEGYEVFVNNSDITTKEGIRELMAKTGTPDAVVISGYANSRASLDGDDADADAIVAAVEENILSAFQAAKHFGTKMLEEGRGTILFLSSIFADKPTGGNPAYAISQGALQMFMRELSMFFGNLGLRSNMIKLAPLASEDVTFESDVVTATYDIETKVPTHLRVDAQDALGAILYFLSDYAKNANGTDLKLDGGLLYFYGDRSYTPVKEVDLP